MGWNNNPAGYKDNSYPESTMFGQLPAYGFYCRHVKGLKLNDVQLQTAQPDLRHAVACDDVEDLEMVGLDVRPTAGAASILRLTQVRDALIRGCRPHGAADTFVELHGETTRDVLLMENDFSRMSKVAALSPEVPSGALEETANHSHKN